MDHVLLADGHDFFKYRAFTSSSDRLPIANISSSGPAVATIIVLPI